MMIQQATLPRIAAVFAMAVVIAVAVMTVSAPTTEAAGCGPCQGPTQAASAYAAAPTCAEARQEAETQATINAFGGAPSCIPCQGSLASYCSDIVVCRPAPGGVCEKTAFATYTYQCKACGPF